MGHRWILILVFIDGTEELIDEDIIAFTHREAMQKALNLLPFDLGVECIQLERATAQEKRLAELAEISAWAAPASASVCTRRLQH